MPCAQAGHAVALSRTACAHLAGTIKEVARLGASDINAGNALRLLLLSLQAHSAAVEGAISEAASTSQVGFLLAATLLQPGREPGGGATAGEGSSLAWSSLPLTFPGLTTAELDSGQAQPAAADSNSRDHLLAAPAATAGADVVGSKRPSGSEAAATMPHLKRGRVQPAEGDFSTPADSSDVRNRPPSTARGVSSGRLPNGLGRLPNGLGSTERERSGKDRQAWLPPESVQGCFLGITSEGLDDS